MSHPDSTRLELNVEFLHGLLENPLYEARIHTADAEQLKSVLECLRNVSLFKKRVGSKLSRQINFILVSSLSGPTDSRIALTNYKSVVQEVLACIFRKVIKAEIRELISSGYGEIDESGGSNSL